MVKLTFDARPNGGLLAPSRLILGAKPQAALCPEIVVKHFLSNLGNFPEIVVKHFLSNLGNFLLDWRRE